MKSLFLAATLGVSLAVVLCGCGTTTKYGDAKAVETLTADFGSTDLQMITEKMVKSLVAYPGIATAGERPVLIFTSLRNLTSEIMETDLINDMIRTEVIKSGKVRVAAGGPEFEAALREIKFGQSGLIDSATAKKVGKKVGADYITFGGIKSITKYRNGDKDVYYQFTLNLLNVENGYIEWSDQEEIRKTREVPLITM